jgi:hypothetical protein
MAEVPVGAEAIQFLVKLLLASREGTIEWEESQHQDLVHANLAEGYAVVLREVPDLDDPDDPSLSPDYIVTLLGPGGAELFSLSRLTVSADDLAPVLGEEVRYSYVVFKALWDRALIKARKVADHLAVVNRLLDAKIKR